MLVAIQFYTLKFSCEYNNKPLTNITFATYDNQSVLSYNFLQNSVLNFNDLQIHRYKPNYILESGDFKCGTGFCSHGDLYSESPLTSPFKYSLAATGLEYRIGSGFYVQLSNKIKNQGSIFGYMVNGDEVAQKLKNIQIDGDKVIGDLKLKFLFYEEK
ncbi:Peptidyl-prolyl cis-trans isomerase [Spironucleus salmonicida]|uniref:Peptidyl-prolyl cis-trans isomerase n=1 Tax=Spironucleus salmonicida TaxID=348837 RepID=V6LDA6_9EUKA|nr:Peptidyl-prolyl cis-trans isomerase [Spironucleus salmonicida]|eukprot:EST42462.1 Peptidyl-prolyl cis-trans isomerase [Spironucleus salmonicida]